MLQQMRNYVRGNIKTKRPDARAHTDARPVVIETGLLERAEGSARVRMGDTDVIVGVKLDVGEPYPDTMESGVLTTNAELSPMADPDFEAGKPGEDAIELARVVDRGIRESGMIDLPKLCVTPGKKVWIVYIDIQPVNNDGNLISAAGIAAVAALQTTKIPKLNEDGTVNRDGEYEGTLPVRDKPIPVVMAKIGETIVVDPSRTEEEVMDGMLMVTTNKDGELCAMQKSGAFEITEDEVLKCVDLSVKIGKELRKKL